MKKRQANIVRYTASLLLGFILFNLIWYALAYFLNMSSLPFPQDVYLSYQKAIDSNIHSHITASLRRILLGTSISLFIALILGVLTGYFRRVNHILSPLLYFSYPLPKLASLPIIMVLFGIGDVSKVIIIVFIIVFQMTITIRDAIRNIPK